MREVSSEDCKRLQLNQDMIILHIGDKHYFCLVNNRSLNYERSII